MSEMAKILYNIEVKTGKTKFGSGYSIFYLKTLQKPEEIDFSEMHTPRGGIASIIIFYDDNAVTIRPTMFYYHAPNTKGMRNNPIPHSRRTPRSYTGRRMLSFGRGKNAIRVAISKKNHILMRKFMYYQKGKKYPIKYTSYADEAKFKLSLRAIISQWMHIHAASMWGDADLNIAKRSMFETMTQLVGQVFLEKYAIVKETANARQKSNPNISKKSTK